MCRNHQGGLVQQNAAPTAAFDGLSPFSATSSVTTLHPHIYANGSAAYVASSSTQSFAPTSSGAIDKNLISASACRRRSVDVGGLALALGAVSIGDNGGIGKGWGGWQEDTFDTEPSGAEDGAGGALYAELLSDMYTQTQNLVNVTVLPPFPVIEPATRENLIDALDSWHFEPHKLPDDEVFACTQLLFEALLRIEGMEETVKVNMTQISSFLLHLRQAYRASNSYHNFQHALDVLQATYMYLRVSGAVPPVSILHFSESFDPHAPSFSTENALLNGNGYQKQKRAKGKGKWAAADDVKATWIGILRKEDLFALYIAAAGHDVGHPGFNNIFMKNAQAPLSQVYDHKSALERMHCAFLLPIMKQHGLAHLLSNAHFPNFRKLLLETVLSTDMGVHSQFMQKLGELMENPQTFNIVQARILICQALIKCADISNPSRPHTVSQHWSAALAAEWASQAFLERKLHLPVSVQEQAHDPVTEAKGQIGFITMFCQPLLDATVVIVPEMKPFSDQCSRNCKFWQARLSELVAERTIREQEPNYPPIPYRVVEPPAPQPQDYLSVFPLSLPTHFLLSPKLNGVDGGDADMEGIHDGSLADSLSSEHNGTTDGFDTSSSSTSRSSSPFSNGTQSAVAQRQCQLPSISTSGLPSHTDMTSPPTSGSTSASPSPRSGWPPRTPGGNNHRPPSVASNVSGISGLSSISGLNGANGKTAGTLPEPMASIRAALKLSVRKKKSFHRNSWTPSPGSLSHYPAFSLNVGPSPLFNGSADSDGDSSMNTDMGDFMKRQGSVDTTMSEA